MIDVKNYKKEAVIQYCKPSKRPMQKYRITFFTNCHRRNRIASATFLLSQGLARSVNLSSNNFEQQLDTEGINCWDINRKRKFPHFKKERQWEPSAIEIFGKSNINIMIDVKNYKKEAVIQYCKPSKRPMQKYRNHIVFQAEFQIEKI